MLGFANTIGSGVFTLTGVAAKQAGSAVFVAFTLAGLIAGVSGGLFAFHEGFIGPGQLGPVLSTQAVLYVLFGGSGTLIGAVLGVAIIELISYVLPQFSWLGETVTEFLETGWPVVLGLLLLGTVMFRPTGLIGLLVSDRERVGSFGRAVRAAPMARGVPLAPARTSVSGGEVRRGPGSG